MDLAQVLCNHMQFDENSKKSQNFALEAKYCLNCQKLTTRCEIAVYTTMIEQEFGIITHIKI